ncbi:MAG TPA: ATP synthase F0 subunit B [Clostridium sp.]|uniref:ATP synthase subunit b n=1 Tax=Clostridium lapidicellarium TaxID=3240931 RepID=A0ABV4DTQ7_9CLOT|nr:F0F1 ATP synthase subunit B [uncultured Clostridium sp.]NLU08923.1 F0F1 ATP synthase subunit B [Clostridiales bacterium]HBC95605.1 ATP synthase F0 subunit B [Clostridium sp.]
MEFNLFRIIATIINFGLLVLILKHFLFDRVNRTIDNRQNEIVGKISSAEENMKKAQSLKEKSEKQLSNTRETGKSIVEEYKVKADKVSSNIVKDAQNEAQLILKRAKTEAEREREKAQDDIKNQVVDLAMLVSSKALEGSIDEKQHRKLIEDFITKVGI